MIHTLSLCNECYRKIPAQISFIDGKAVMSKECDVHGPQSAIVEKDVQHVSNFYNYGTLGNNNTIIVHAHNQCNMACPWCYYPMGVEKTNYPFYHFNALLGLYKSQGFNLLLSGGEPTLRPDFFEFVREAHANGWFTSSITNMLKLGDDEFFQKTLTPDFITPQGVYKFAMSMQHPKNYGKDELQLKFKALENIEKKGLNAMCCMFSIQSLDELDYIREFYDKTKHCYTLLRIRTMFRNWANKGNTHHIWLSDLHKHFMRVFGDLHPVQSRNIEMSNIYCLYMQTDDGMNMSLSSSPTVENLDYNICSRPVHMLARDGRCYSVPIAQIVNEGFDKGWYSGFRLTEEDKQCT